MWKNKFKEKCNKILDEKNKFIFKTLSILDKDFSKCYICRKQLTPETFALLELPTEKKALCLCFECMKRFRKETRFYSNMFFNNRDKEAMIKIKNNEITLPELIHEQLLQLSFAHKIWLDKQRRLYGERRNKN